jgi:hypothetical protein
MNGRRISGALAAGACLAVLLSAAPIRAHLGSTKFLRVEPTDTGARVEVDLDAIDASMELGLGPEVDLDAVLGREAQIRAWIAEGVQLRGEGGPCGADAGPVRAIRRDGRPHVTLTVEYRCPPPAHDRVLRDDTVFDDDPQHEAIVRLGGPGWADAAVLRGGSREVRVGEPPSTLRLLGVFLWEGMLHLVTGYDHVLFLLSLILAAGFVAVRSGMRRALIDVAILVTAFTVGHSITLIAAALEVVVLPSRPVEAIIAGSIVLVAAHNVVRPEARGPMPWLGFFFGLIHGFGFSSVLAEIGLPREQTVLALVAFNVGIEVAQLAFVALVLGPIAWAARSPAYRNVVVRGGSVVIAVIATVWLAERLVG